jgi:hypothetical protein
VELGHGDRRDGVAARLRRWNGELTVAADAAALRLLRAWERGTVAQRGRGGRGRGEEGAGAARKARSRQLGDTATLGNSARLAAD